MLPPKLDYLFIAYFRDGTRYFQTPADTSVISPLTRSAFYDVQQRLSEVEKFTLTDGKHEHTVFLDDGHFKSDGKIILAPAEPGPLTNFRMIYFRRIQVNIKGRSQVAFFFLGWQANDAAGKNFQMLLQIAPSGSLLSPVVTRQ